VSDPYQARYLEHLQRKAAMIASDSVPTETSLTDQRRSIRVFQDRPVPELLLHEIFEAVRAAPQSCNRQALTLSVVPGSEVGGWLLGGRGWAEKAPVIVLVFADLAAYKSPYAATHMPWVDAGVALGTIVYAAFACGLGSCIISFRVDPEAEVGFRALFNPHGRLFCGAVALGYSGITPDMPEKKPLSELVERWDGS